MASVILNGFKDLEQAQAFAEWFGYSYTEVFTPTAAFTVEAELGEKEHTNLVEMDVITRELDDISMPVNSLASIFEDDF